MKKWFYILLAMSILFLGYNFMYAKKLSILSAHKIGQEIDRLNGVKVYYNGSVKNVSGRNTINGYNLGLKYQCVEFVKRYYYKKLDHKMPDTYGHAKDFFILNLSDGEINKLRNLHQYKNGSKTRPKVDDLIVFEGTIWNKYGHVAIISKVTKNTIEIVQQNVGTASRDKLNLEFKDSLWFIKSNTALGWLRK